MILLLLPHVIEWRQCACGELWVVSYKVIDRLWPQAWKKLEAELAMMETSFCVHKTGHVLDKINKGVLSGKQV